MADVAEIQLMKVTSFSDGVDTYKGIRQIGYRYNPLPTVGVRLEGELRPTRLEAVEDDSTPYSGTVTMSGPNASALIGTTINTATVDVKDVTTAADTKRLTITNMLIKGVNTTLTNRQIGEYAYDFDATDIAVADAA